MDDSKLRNLLNRPNVPSDLEKKVLSNWHAQRKTDAKPNHRTRYRRAAAAAFITLFALIAYPVFITPTLVVAAVKDIDSDSQRPIGLSIPISTIVADARIQAPLPEMRVVMTKRCKVNRAETFHIEIAGALRGEVHMFVKTGRLDIPLWHLKQGHYRDLSWRLIHPRENLSVLVMYTPDMDPENVQKLIQQMFYG